MQWKYFLPDLWTNPAARVALEDVYLIPPEGKSGPSSYVFTLEGLRSFTGGTYDEKLELLGSAEYAISDTMDMLVRRDDFDKQELLEWTRLFIRVQFGDPVPALVEASEADRAGHVPGSLELHAAAFAAGVLKLVFVHAPGGTAQALPERVLEKDPRVDVRTLVLNDAPYDPQVRSTIEWADVIVVMDKRMRHGVRRSLKHAGLVKRVVCLHLPEHHDQYDPVYLELFRERIDVYLQRFSLKRAP